MARKRRKSDERPQKIRELRAKGLKWADVAEEMGLSANRCMQLAKIGASQPRKTRRTRSKAADTPVSEPEVKPEPTVEIKPKVEQGAFSRLLSGLSPQKLDPQPDQKAELPPPMPPPEPVPPPIAAEPPKPPTVTERVKKAATAVVQSVAPDPRKTRLEAQKKILAYRVKGEFIPRDLRIHDDLRLTGKRQVRSITKQMAQDGAQMEDVDRYVERAFAE